MKTKDEALKLALFDIERYQTKRKDFDRFENTVIKIKEALAQPKQKPVAWFNRPEVLAINETEDWNDDSQRIVDKAKQDEIAELRLLIAATPPAAQPEQESLEYWNAVEGWVKIDEVRKHFDSVGCGTIYKTAGEDRTPLYTSPPRPDLTDADRKTYQAGHNAGVAHHKQATKREWVGLTDDHLRELGFSTRPRWWAVLEAKLKELNA
jgi:hypothetical protein